MGYQQEGSEVSAGKDPQNIIGVRSSESASDAEVMQ